MWIPDFKRPDRNVVLAVETAAQGLNRKKLLRELYLRLIAKATGPTVKVATEMNEGEMAEIITPVQAYHANLEGLLGEECSEESGGWGKTNYTRHFYWRELDLVK